MNARSFTVFAAGFIAGGITLHGLAHANITLLNLSIAGVPPNSQGSLLCTTSAGRVRAIVGTVRPITVSAGSGGTSGGASLSCPAE